MGVRLLTMDEIIPDENISDYDRKLLKMAWLSPDGQYHESMVTVRHGSLDYTPNHIKGSIRLFPINSEYYRIIIENNDTMGTITPVACTITPQETYIITTCNGQRITIDERSITCIMESSRFYSDTIETGSASVDMGIGTNTHIENAIEDYSTMGPNHTDGTTGTGMSNGNDTGCTSNQVSTVNLGKQPVFHPDHQRMDKWQALKILEESAEIVETCKQYLDNDTLGTAPIALEIADLLQTTVNLIDAYGITQDQLNEAIKQTILKNKDRGMFTSGERTHMHRDDDSEK